MTSAASAASATSGYSPALTVRSMPIADAGAELIELLADPHGVAWSRNGEGLVGWGRVAELRCRGADRFAEAKRWWTDLVAHAAVRDEVGLPGSGLIAFGSFGFADHATGPTGDSVLSVPEFILGHRGGQWWVTTVGVEDHLPPLPPSLVVAEIADPGELSFADGARSPAQWQTAVATAVRRISSGELDKVVLARDLDVHAVDPIDPRWPLRRLADRYASCFTFAVDGLIGATPELLVRLEGRLVTSRVLAGTIQRTGSLSRDEALAGSLARSSKDLEEHEYGVTSVAEALAPHCTGMNVPEAPFVLHLPNVMHLATDITGVVSDGSTALDLIAALHPTAAVCGTPRATATAVIDQIEGMDRGRYAGPVGWIAANGAGEFGIALRSGEIDPADPRHMRLFAGCGIVADSDPDAELAESNAKLLPMRDALSS
ncbi:MAG: isochorismate synthase [Jatrophihabitans sp.]